MALALITGWSLWARGQGQMLESWGNTLRQIFGWGTFAVPLGSFAGGLWMILRNLRRRLPAIPGERILGSLLLYIALLVLLHAFVGAGDLSRGMAEARLGRGGGMVGAALLALSLRALGGGGTGVVLVGWILVGATLALGISLPQLLSLGWKAWANFAEGVSARWPWRSLPLKSDRGSRRAASDRPSVPRGERMPQPAAGSLETNPQAVPQTHMANAQTEIAAPREIKMAWRLPEFDQILIPGSAGRVDEEFDRQRGRLIEETLRAFGAPAHIVEINRGPTITQFGVEPDFIEGRGGRRTKVKVSKISSLADDLALALAAPSVRIEAPVPSKGYVGIEVPNADISLVSLRDVISGPEFEKIHSRLRMGLGQDVSGRPVVADLTEMPHLLIAGTTGSGKSVCVNAIIACLLLQNTPEDIKFLMVDPKRVELTVFNGVPHLLAPVVVDLERVVPALQWLSREMDERYRRFARQGVRHLAEYNQRMQAIQGKELPVLIVVIDELADLMMLAPDETERVITRLAQLARATGIHLVIATQRPSVDVVTGLIKANFPARIAFAVASSVDSRVILDQPGAERLLGRGDMLFQAPDAAAPIRLQGSFVSDHEMRNLIRYWKNAALGGETTRPVPAASAQAIPPGVPLQQPPLWDQEPIPNPERDVLFDEAVQVVRNMRRASISLLQRRLRIGYTRAARLIDQLEAQGIVGPAKGGSQPREVLDYLGPETPDKG